MSTLMLIDGHALAYRAYHAFPPLTTPKGELVNAVYGFTRILLTVLRDLEPKYIACSFDLPAPTFRHTAYTGYKAQRKEMPADLQTQIDRIKEVVQALNIPIFAVEGYEADDVIGTIATRAASGDMDHVDKVLIVTGDRDAFQLVTENIHVYLPPRGKDPFYLECGPEQVTERMGIGPEQIVDYKSLAGDASDNIPGVRGVGEKTAVRLLQAFGTSEGIYEAMKTPENLTEEQKKLLKPKVIENLMNGYDDMKLSRDLATIDRNVPLTLVMEDCVVKNYDKKKATALLEEFDFKSLIKQLPQDQFEESVQEALF
ncbi:MAG TPA: 5'-3' exonuclease H3TH domain-containing protein [Patescibacteria group bacterium]|nr:5'-3' exonuclease H3TH domain-containing protein [Patescibacteria group bacterium]